MSLSVVIPVYNEVESLPHLQKSLHAALGDLAIPWEIVYVDDGSSDGSRELLARLADEDAQHVRAVLFRRNYGQTAAMAAGVDYARGQVIAFMDGDLQNDPADIPMMLEKMEEGFDVICGWRKHRQDAAVTRKLPSRIANRIIAKVTGVRLNDYGCSLKLFRREIIRGFRLYGEMHRFIPVYAQLVGGKILEVPVRHHARKFGKTKYGLGRTLKVILDLCTVRLLTAFATKPMYLFGKPGLHLMGLGILLIPIAVAMGVCFPAAGAMWPLLILAALGLLGGFQCILMGLLAELQMRTYYESQRKRNYVVQQVLGDAAAVEDGEALDGIIV